ncbi:MAG TPA: hypothetical protein VJJ70_02400 [Anaerolineales bacterium]|nr:hypothetical protein [Anaerolineales bacterium]
MSTPSSIAGLNALDPDERDRLYAEIIPRGLFERFAINSETFCNAAGQRVLEVKGKPGSSAVEVKLRHEPDAKDPVLYAHLTDTVNGQLLIMLYIINDPHSERFDTDRLPDGTPTEFGVFRRNLPAEEAAFRAGLTPGQVRHGLRVLRQSIESFEQFVARLGLTMFFAEPLAYHNAVVFEQYGFTYQQGLRWMESIDTRFRKDGDLLRRLDGSTVFRQPGAELSIRGRSWAIHDGVLNEPFTGVHMYKMLGKHAGLSTFADGVW